MIDRKDKPTGRVTANRQGFREEIPKPSHTASKRPWKMAERAHKEGDWVDNVSIYTTTKSKKRVARAEGRNPNEANANAEHIVKCVNSHEAHLKAHKAALAYDHGIQGHAKQGKSWVTSDELDKLYDEWITAVKSALKLAGEGE